MQISRATKEELGFIIMGLRAIHIQDEKQCNMKDKLLAQMESELSTRFGATVRAG